MLANELSIHEQYHNISSFRTALTQFMNMRQIARKFNREVNCNRNLLNARPIPNLTLQMAIGKIPSDSERRAAMLWLNNTGSYWDDIRKHGQDDWLEFEQEVVTDSAVGEAAFRSLHSVECGIVSFTPSKWNFSPVNVSWRYRGAEFEDKHISVDNWFNANLLEDKLRDSIPPVQSWGDLRTSSTNRFVKLVFFDNCFEPLEGIPFAKYAADRFLVLFEILDQLACSFDNTGTRTAKGQEIYQSYFTGKHGLFSDSSQIEKNQFRSALTFRNPSRPMDSYFCPWHGKIGRSDFRIHFTWPIKCNEPVYIVYAGPKITKI